MPKRTKAKKQAPAPSFAGSCFVTLTPEQAIYLSRVLHAYSAHPVKILASYDAGGDIQTMTLWPLAPNATQSTIRFK